MRAIGFLILACFLFAAPAFCADPFDDKATGDPFAGEGDTLIKSAPVYIQPTPTPSPTPAPPAATPIPPDTFPITPETHYSPPPNQAILDAVQPDLPHDPATLELQAEDLKKKKKYLEARQLFLLIPKNTFDPALAQSARHRAAQCLFEADKIVEFEAEAKTLIAGNQAWDRYYRETRMALARIPEKQGQPLEAIRQLEALQKEFIDYPGKGDDQIFEHHLGRLYFKAIPQLLQAGKTEEANACRAKGRFNLAREREIIQQRIRNGELPDEYPRRFNYLQTYFVEKDFDGLEREAASVCAAFPRPSESWGMGMLWMGMSKASRNPPDNAGAAAAFDAILEANVVDQEEHGHLALGAANWRVYVSDKMRDAVGRAKVVEYVRKMPESEERTEALKRYDR